MLVISIQNDSGSPLFHSSNNVAISSLDMPPTVYIETRKAR
jgi:hypothetical protein